MSELSRLMLTRLGWGESIGSVCAAAAIPREEFDAWWQAEIGARTPQVHGTRTAPVRGDVEIVRDAWGIPHIFAGSDADLFFGFGWAMAQDRLWQLDYLRRKALGRLAEILGAEAVEQDALARTVGIPRIAAAEVKRLPASTLHLLEAFAQGINAAIGESRERLPIEFALLDYAPEPWTPLDSVAIWGEFRWYLTGRLPVIVYPELARRRLGSEALYRAFLTPEAGEESILPAGSYPSRRSGTEKVGETAADPQDGIGSNNWTVAGSRAATGVPMLASDPHIAFGAVSCWYEVHLFGGSFHVVGMAYAGVPAVLMGRNEQVAWGVTNNICSQRDLYQERTDPQHPGCFFVDGRWEPARETTETIAVRDSEPVHKTIRYSRNGPLVDELLPKPARDLGPVSLRWLGAAFGDELTCLHQANRARSNAEFRESLRAWQVPTWNLVFADREGHIGYQCVGRIPLRDHWERGFRPGWDPAHQWRDVIPFDGLPALSDPQSGWIRSANNRNAPEDFPYPLSGTWSSGYRAERIRHMLEEQQTFTLEDFRRMHQDVLSRRAVEGVPPLLRCLVDVTDMRVQHAAELLRQWDGRMETDQVAASIFDLFFLRWSEMVAAERFPSDVAALLAGAIGGLALELLAEDAAGWFAQADRVQKVVAAFQQALQELEARLGPDPSRWQWGNLHTITLRHPLSRRGELSQLLDRGGYPLGGNGFTVCNTGYEVSGAGYQATHGANYRLIADLGAAPQGLWAVDAAGQSGHPGSEHYCDQLTEWLAGRYHFLPLDRSYLTEKARLILRTVPPG
jgi:penicillin amidase